MGLLPSVSKDYDRKSAVICVVYIPDLVILCLGIVGGFHYLQRVNLGLFVL